MRFRVTGLSPEPFRPLFGLSDAALADHGAKRCVADAKPGFPDRISLRDAEPGETVLLVHYQHQPANTPYRASHAVYVREGATQTCSTDTVPESLRVRLISLRAFDADDLMIDADVVDGQDLDGLIQKFFANPAAAYLHAHYAKRGCYAARIDRA
jgi:hypothetical protein